MAFILRSLTASYVKCLERVGSGELGSWNAKSPSGELGGVREELSQEPWAAVDNAAHALALALLAAREHAAQDKNGFRERGGLEMLVALLYAGPDSLAAAKAAGVITWITELDGYEDELRRLGSVPPLVSLLTGRSEAAASAVCALANLACGNESNKEAIREAGGIPLLVTLLTEGAESETVGSAASALRNLTCGSDSNRKAIREAGGIPALVALLREETAVATSAVGALGNLAHLDSNREAIRQAGGIPMLRALLSGGVDLEATLTATDVLRSIAFNNNTNREAIREAGCIPPLVALLRKGAGSEAATNAAAVLDSIATDNSTNREAIREAGAILPLVALLGAGAKSQAGRNAVDALKTIAQDNFDNQKAMLTALAQADFVLAKAFEDLLRELQPAARRLLEESTATEFAPDGM